MKILLLSLLFLVSLHAKPLVEGKKLILLYAELEYCGWCKKMRQESIDDPQSKAEIEKRYHIAKILKESGDLPLFVHPTIFPTIYLLSYDGSEILQTIVGYMPKRRFLETLKEVYEVENETGE